MITLNQRNYVFPAEQPVSKQELTRHIKLAEKSGYAMSFEQYNKKVEQWLDEH